MSKAKVVAYKSFLRSKTVWFNALAVVIFVANMFGFAEFQMDERLGELLPLLVMVGNVALRFKTSQPIVLSRTDPK